jgi:hypothetical protein
MDSMGTRFLAATGYAYILSQKHEGSALLANRYGEGGFSEGSMKHHALK